MSGLGILVDHKKSVYVPLPIARQKKIILFVCLPWHSLLLWCECLLFPYTTLFRSLFLTWIISQGNPAMEINHFEGNGPEWLVCKGILCFWQRARLWEGERESTYWCMSAALTLYLFLSFSYNIPLSYLFSFYFFFLILVFYFLVFKFLMSWYLLFHLLYTARASL